MNDDEALMMSCPKCGAEQEDCDGFGVLYCQNCKYCTHSSQDGDGKGNWECGLCGRVTPMLTKHWYAISPKAADAI